VALAAVDVDSLEQVADPSYAGVERGVLQDPGHLIDGLSDELGCDPQRSFGDIRNAEGRRGLAQLYRNSLDLKRDPLGGIGVGIGNPDSITRRRRSTRGSARRADPVGERRAD